MATFKADVDQFLPDIREILDLSAKQIDALPTCNLGVEAKFFSCFAQGDKLVRGNFTARDAWNDRVQAATLHVRQKAVVGILQRLVFGPHDMFVPQRRQHGRNGRLANLAALASAVLSNDVVKGRELFRLDNGEQLGACMREV